MSSHKKLVTLLREAAPPATDDQFAQDVMRRVRATPRTVQPRWWLLAATSLAAILFFLRPSDPFTARGRAVTVSDFAARCFVQGAELHAGDSVRDNAGLTFVAEHPRETVLMLFAIDAAQQMHWFYPAYLDESSDPPPVSLTGPPRETLPDGVMLDHPALGPMRVVALFGDESLRVHAVETMLASHASQPLEAIFPRAQVRSLSLLVTGPTP